MYIYVKLGHLAVHQKLTEHCKSTHQKLTEHCKSTIIEKKILKKRKERKKRQSGSFLVGQQVKDLIVMQLVAQLCKFTKEY